MRNSQKNQSPKPSARACAKAVLRSMKQVIDIHIPDFYDRIKKIPDHRKHLEYTPDELVFGAISLFLFKSTSRNQHNQLRSEKKFIKNYKRLFKMRLPHLDTVEDFLRVLEAKELELLKAKLVAILIEKKMFYRFRFLGKFYCVAVDGTGISSYNTDYCGECLSKKHKNKTTYHHMVLEAKLVLSNGISLSIASQWIENTDSADGNKQDCEQNAFKRLAPKIKSFFPRLPITILADGLYPNQSFFKICKDNQWNYIVTFKDGSLKTVQEEISFLKKTSACGKFLKQDQKGIAYFKWLNNQEYHDYCLNWVEYEKVYHHESRKDYFVYVTNIEITANNVREIVKTGRMRWNIEIHGFDHQKNHGYNLGHKFSRASYLAMKNYYQCMQLAHLIEQLSVLSIPVLSRLKEAKITMKYCWERLKAFLMENVLKADKIASWTQDKIQLRLL